MRLAGGLVAAAAMGAAPLPAVAASWSFTLADRSQAALVVLQVQEDGEWGGNRLSRPLQGGEVLYVTVDTVESGCRLLTRAILSDGMSFDMTVDYCNLYTLDVHDTYMTAQ